MTRKTMTKEEAQAFFESGPDLPTGLLAGGPGGSGWEAYDAAIAARNRARRRRKRLSKHVGPAPTSTFRSTVKRVNEHFNKESPNVK